jgi:hypothetical protein
VRFNDVSTGLRSEESWRRSSGDRSGWIMVGVNGSPFSVVPDMVSAN